MNARFLIVVALAGLFGSAAAKEGGGGSATPNPGMPQERRLQQSPSADPVTPTHAVTPGFQIDGTVKDGSGTPLGSVVVKLFSNGIVAASAQTAADGTFRIEANPAIGGDNTSVLWVQSPSPDKLLDAEAVLSEGSAAREAGLFPECVEHVSILGNHASVAVTLMTLDEAKAAVERTKCLEGGS